MTVSIGSTAAGPSTGGRGSADSQVRVHRGPSVAAQAAALDARSFTRDREIYLPASHGSLESGPGRALLAHELTHVAQQTRLGSSLPLEHTPHGQALEAEAVAAERSGGLPMALRSRPATGSGTPAPASANGAQRAPTEAPDEPPTPGDGATTFTLSGGTQRAPARATAPTPGADPADGRRAHSEQELEELAGQLYARIGRRLRREILVDRERTGLALDLR